MAQMATIRSIWKDENGQSMVEYGIILGLVAVVCVGGFRLVGNEISKALSTLLNSMKGGK
ncbi:MAG: Flp family type IVb pilin [Cyanobacteria bacterium NC_groundwater_1444_Ag_S-0.65um_54_12]|nr:Flp family type IVb pilin [Cyanobacteria bacterium NC_groundwater_1444_Ag_S-0.65um_54_12]